MLTSLKFNIAVGLPALSFVGSGKNKLVFTGHAFDRSKQKAITLPSCIEIQKTKIVEVEVCPESRRVSKILARFPHCADYDLVIPLIPDSMGKFCVAKTAWLNHREDNHKTLDTKGIEDPKRVSGWKLLVG